MKSLIPILCLFVFSCDAPSFEEQISNLWYRGNMDFTEELMFNIDGTGYIRKYEEGVWSPKQNIRWKIKSAKYLNVDKEYKYVSIADINGASINHLILNTSNRDRLQNLIDSDADKSLRSYKRKK